MVRKLLVLLLAGFLSLGAVHPALAKDDSGAVYLMTNAAAGNRVQVYHRAEDGSLAYAGAFATGGLGSGLGVTVPPDPLGSQDSLVISPDGHWLLAVNAGSNDISLFKIRGDRLQLANRVSSGGDYPVSLTMHKDLVYVLNAGEDGSISGFRLEDSRLKPLSRSTRSLHAATPADGAQPNILEAPAQIGFTPGGEQLVITDKGGVSGVGRILVFKLGSSGRPDQDFVATETANPVPFSFTFDRYGHLEVVDASAGSISAYQLRHNGSVNLLGAVTNGQAAVCWIDNNGKYLFTDNTGSGTISALKPSASGSPLLLNASAAVTGTGTLPLDVGISRSGKFLYTWETGAGAIGEYRINADGTLSLIGTLSGLPVVGGFQGIAVN
jgi:6-phosphogluconolactonase